MIMNRGFVRFMEMSPDVLVGILPLMTATGLELLSKA